MMNNCWNTATEKEFRKCNLDGTQILVKSHLYTWQNRIGAYGEWNFRSKNTPHNQWGQNSVTSTPPFLPPHKSGFPDLLAGGSSFPEQASTIHWEDSLCGREKTEKDWGKPPTRSFNITHCTFPHTFLTFLVDVYSLHCSPLKAPNMSFTSPGLAMVG